jgi:soluble lytic murein transglycosylase
MRPSLALCFVLLAGCYERRFAGPPPSESAGSGSPAASEVASAGSAAAPPLPEGAGGAWLEAVRLERWSEAATLIDALPEPFQARADMRYVRARAAVGTGDGARALTLLDGLETALPLLVADITHWRAEAQLLVGPYAPAAVYFARSRTARDLTRAADAFLKAGDLPAARATAEHAVAAAAHGKSSREEAAARMKRAEIARTPAGEAGDAAAEPDLRWVATHAAGTPEGRAAAEALDRMKRPLSPKERLLALEGLDPVSAATAVTAPVLAPSEGADGGSPIADDAGPTAVASDGGGPAPVAEEGPPPPPPARRAPGPGHPAGLTPAARAIAQILAAATPPGGKPVPRGEMLHARAMALFRAREYEAAATAFRDAAAAASGHEPEDLHYAARALSRADRDADAVKAYHAMVARYPRSPFAEKSTYYAARLELLGGHFKEAAQAYTRYLGTYRRGEHRDEAEYERALSWLSSGDTTDAGSARKALGALAHKARDDRGARLRELSALAADRSGDRPAALATWTELARNQPLTWAALMSRARLAAAGAPVPPLMDGAATGAPSASRGPLEVRLPPAPALLSSLGLDGDAESRLLAEEREAVAPYAGREGEALCGLYGKLSRAKRRYRVGINTVEGAWLLRPPTAGERWAWECLYPRPFSAGVRALEEQLGLPRGLVYAVMRQESGFDPAIVSPASAVGLMQLMPATAKQAASELSLPFDEADLTRPDVNLRLGAFYIAKLLRMFQGHVGLAAAAYNAGPRAVSHWVEASSAGDLDLWVARIPFDETRNYVARVVQNFSRYQWLEGGDEAVTPVTLAIPSGARAPADAY